MHWFDGRSLSETGNHGKARSKVEEVVALVSGDEMRGLLTEAGFVAPLPVY